MKWLHRWARGYEPVSEDARLIYLAGEVSSFMTSVGQWLGIFSLLTLQENYLCPQLWASRNRQRWEGGSCGLAKLSPSAGSARHGSPAAQAGIILA